jgi:hypothetical protein
MNCLTFCDNNTIRDTDAKLLPYDACIVSDFCTFLLPPSPTPPTPLPPLQVDKTAPTRDDNKQEIQQQHQQQCRAMLLTPQMIGVDNSIEGRVDDKDDDAMVTIPSDIPHP